MLILETIAFHILVLRYVKNFVPVDVINRFCISCVIWVDD